MDIMELRNAFTSGVPVEYKAHCLKRMLEKGYIQKRYRGLYSLW